MFNIRETRDKKVQQKFTDEILKGNIIPVAEILPHRNDFIDSAFDAVRIMNESQGDLNRDSRNALLNLERDLEYTEEDERSVMKHIMDLRAKFFKPTPPEVIDARIARQLALAPKPSITKEQVRNRVWEGEIPEDEFWGDFFDGISDEEDYTARPEENVNSATARPGSNRPGPIYRTNPIDNNATVGSIAAAEQIHPIEDVGPLEITAGSVPVDPIDQNATVESIAAEQIHPIEDVGPLEITAGSVPVDPIDNNVTVGSISAAEHIHPIEDVGPLEITAGSVPVDPIDQNATVESIAAEQIHPIEDVGLLEITAGSVPVEPIDNNATFESMAPAEQIHPIEDVGPLEITAGSVPAEPIDNNATGGSIAAAAEPILPVEIVANPDNSNQIDSIGRTEPINGTGPVENAGPVRRAPVHLADAAARTRVRYLDQIITARVERDLGIESLLDKQRFPSVRIPRTQIPPHGTHFDGPQDEGAAAPLQALIPEVQMTGAEIPEIQVPKERTSDIDIPDVEILEQQIPKVRMSEVQVPQDQIPDVDNAEAQVRMSEVQVPQDQIPDADNAEAQVRMSEVQVPQDQIPDVDNAEAQVPKVRMSEVQVTDSQTIHPGVAVSGQAPDIEIADIFLGQVPDAPRPEVFQNYDALLRNAANLAASQNAASREVPEFDEELEVLILLNDVINDVSTYRLFRRETADWSSKVFMLFCNMWSLDIFAVDMDPDTGRFKVSLAPVPT